MSFADRHGWIPFLRGSDGLTGRERRFYARLHQIRNNEALAESAKFRKQQAEAVQQLRDWSADLDRISVQFAAGAARQLAAMPVKVRTRVRRDPEA